MSWMTPFNHYSKIEKNNLKLVMLIKCGHVLCRVFFDKITKLTGVICSICRKKSTKMNIKTINF